MEGPPMSRKTYSCYTVGVHINVYAVYASEMLYCWECPHQTLCWEKKLPTHVKRYTTAYSKKYQLYIE